jgi:PERQ amino acid-rich with GYF domain-containing protein
VPQENKRERRRSTLESENSQSTRRWREEERETGLLGRRGDRPKKESDAPARNPNPGSSTKWSSRWGPDDHREKERENQTRPDKKLVDVPEKEQLDANPNPSSNLNTEKFTPRPLSETDSRDKWRPRHRQEGPVATYRVAPGFGSERGGGAHQEPIANTGFASGRGRSGSNLGHAGPIGAGPLGRGGGEKAGKKSFRYPRGRLLDIYRKNRSVSGNNEDDHVGFEAVPFVTLPSEVSPLAFLAPDEEEKV